MKLLKSFFNHFFNRYQFVLETLMKGSEFIFDRFNLLHYQCHEINMNCGGSYINYLDWIKRKNAKINSINYDNKCFQYTASGALNYNKIHKEYQKLSLL